MSSEELLLQLEFEPLENQRKVLGQNLSHDSPALDATQEDEEGISELLIAKSHMGIKLRSVQSGIYNDQNAALLIFDVIFQPYTPDKYRFKSARFEITFQGQREFIPYTSTPKVLSFAPVSAWGEVTEEKREWKLRTGVEVNAPSLPVGINTSISASSSSTTGHRMVIQGASRPPSTPFRVWWTLDENKLSKGGLPHHCAFAVVVSCDGPFFATFKSEAQVGSGSLSRSVISKKDTTYTRTIDPQKALGPQFACDGLVDLMRLDINKVYENTSGSLNFQ